METNKCYHNTVTDEYVHVAGGMIVLTNGWWWVAESKDTTTTLISKTDGEAPTDWEEITQETYDAQ